MAGLTTDLEPFAPARPWDAFDAYIFDIDDTLLHCRDAVHYFAFCSALEAVAGQPLNLDGVPVHGSIDPAILRDALTRGGIPESLWLERLNESCMAMSRYVSAHCHEFRIEVLPGVGWVLEHLRSRGAVLGVGSGNLKAIGRAKLANCGLGRYFAFESYSDHCATRADILRNAAEMARGLAGAGASICVIGDTPSDIAAAMANGLEVIAVASGTYAATELSVCAPGRCVSSLLELSGLTQRAG